MSYLLNNPALVAGLLWQHLSMVGIAMLVAALIAVPLGYLAARFPRLGAVVLAGLGAVYTIPSLALMIVLIPFTGLNARTVVVALVVYAQIILVRNVVAGLRGIDPAIVEAARGLGMTEAQVWWRVQLPLALPVMLAGARIATLALVAMATVGALFGAGGLGQLLFEGIQQTGRYDKIWAGTLALAALALTLNAGWAALERAFTPTI